MKHGEARRIPGPGGHNPAEASHKLTGKAKGEGIGMI